MPRRPHPGIFPARPPRPGVPRVLLLALASASLLAGCDYSSSAPPTGPSGTYTPGASPVVRSTGPSGAPVGPTSLNTGVAFNSEQQREKRAIILDAVMSLIDRAALQPGGDNFKQAIEKLNDYFEGTNPADYALTSETRAYLGAQKPLGRSWDEKELRRFESPAWLIQDTRHIEDCMLYYGIAMREAGTGDDLARVRRVFDWMVRHVQLVPAGSLSVPDMQLAQAQARPHDVLLRGMATEDANGWSERGWLFISFCRQLGVDAGLLTYTPQGQKEPVPWICAVLVGKKAYLFDPRLGLPVPGPDGQGVATLDEALSDPRVLARLDLPGQSPYGTTREALRASPSKIGVLLDSSPGYFSPRMRLLQRELGGKNRTILYRDPAEQDAQFAEALGAHFGGTRLWDLPLLVETLLFTNPKFVEATLQSLSLFRPELPLVYARVKQLRGDTSAAIEEYVSFRFADNLKLRFSDRRLMKKAEQEKRDTVPPEVQKALDAYATYFLALAHLDQGNAKQAEFFFNESLRLLPHYGPGQAFYTMFRWGAQSNLGRLAEARGDADRAIACYVSFAPTAQYRGDLILARNLIWANPSSPAPAPLPAPPPLR